jgi:hypothetical protein
MQATRRSDLRHEFENPGPLHLVRNSIFTHRMCATHGRPAPAPSQIVPQPMVNPMTVTVVDAICS